MVRAKIWRENWTHYNFPFRNDPFFLDFNIRSREWSRDIRSNKSFKVTF